MRRLFIILISLLRCSGNLWCQELPATVVQQLEENVNEEEGEGGNDGYLQDLEHFKRHPINLNTAKWEELVLLGSLNDLQIGNLVMYRKLMGKLISLYELQAVPGWDLATIRKLWEFISIEDPGSFNEEFKNRITKGEQAVLIRLSQNLEKAAGYSNDSLASHYNGGPQQVFFRYSYKYKNLLQYGITAEKDAGEPFFNGKMKTGFDFYSFHFFIRKLGNIEALALGDFTVSLGQGLIHWQSMAFKMGTSALSIKRQSPVLKPYNSAGEFNFHRGVGITIRKERWEGTGFISYRRLSSSIAAGENYFSSFQASGYHRTLSELEDRNNLGQLAAGGNISFRDERTRIGVNAIYHRFALPLQKKNEPYNLFAVEGREWYNASIDYAYTGKNFHAFGELAIDRNLHRATINGLVISVDRKVDISLLYRALAKDYQAINGNAFTENTSPSNENGLYIGISIRPLASWLFNAWADIYQFPWLKFGIDYPSYGSSYLLQISYTPSRKTELYIVYRNKKAEAMKQSLRVHISHKVSGIVTLRTRYELAGYDLPPGKREEGYLTYIDLVCKPLMKPFSVIARYLYFETGSYDARIYAYENDVLFSYAVPSFAGRGNHYGILLNYDILIWMSCWLHLNQTVYSNQSSIGTGAAQIEGKRKTGLKIQLQIKF